MAKLTANELKDRTALQLVRDWMFSSERDVTRATDQATAKRITRKGWVEADPASEYSDTIKLSFDGTDYLTELEQPYYT